MATSGELIDETARLMAFPRNAVLYPYRVLRENGVVTKGGRGRSAAQVTARDAASLLIAIAGASQIKDTISAWHDYANLQAQTAEGGEPVGERKPEWTCAALPPHMKELPAGHSFLDALAALIVTASDGTLSSIIRARDENGLPRPGGVQVDVRGPWPQASIRIFYPGCSETLIYREPIVDLGKWSADMEARGYGRMMEHRHFSESMIFPIAKLIAD